MYGYYRADAIVAATPAGSTAYNYAAGGPVLSPALSGSVVTPVAPMAGIDRSVVLAARERYRFDIAEGTRSAALEVDGLVVGEVATGAQLEVRLRKDAGSVVRLDAERHGRTGRLKLGLLDLPLRPDQLIEPHPARPAAEAATRDRGLTQAEPPGPARPDTTRRSGREARGTTEGPSGSHRTGLIPSPHGSSSHGSTRIPAPAPPGAGRSLLTYSVRYSCMSCETALANRRSFARDSTRLTA